MAQEQPAPLPARDPVIHNVCLAGAVLTPLAMLLPPRRMDVRFCVLAGAFSLCTNQLAYEYTGQSMYARFGSRAAAIFDSGLPEGARRTQQLLREQRERDAAERRKQAERDGGKAGAADGGLIKGIWMGGEDEDWSEKRAEAHRKSFREGKGMSDIITEQVMDVWHGNWRGKGGGGGSGNDEPRR